MDRSGVPRFRAETTGLRKRRCGKKDAMSGQDRVERRSADRVADSSVLAVSGVNRAGQAFREETRIRDVSPGGISFVLRTPVSPGASLDLSLCSEQGIASEATLKFQTRAQVLRVYRDTKASGHFLVAARFEGEVVNLSGDLTQEALIRELQQAVAYDESRRHQFEFEDG